MQLSLWMLADRLKKYKPRLHIERGLPTIVGVRFISENLVEWPEEYVYIGYGSYAFADLRLANSFMLIHRNDFILISGLDLESLLNEVMAAFDYYNRWESRLWQALSDPNPYQRLADVGVEVLGNPICIGDYEGNVLALSQRFGPDDVDDRWRELHETGLIPTSYTGPPILTEQGEMVADWLEEPRQYQYENGVKYICANIYADEEQLAGFYLQQQQHEFTLGHVQLASVLCNVLTSAVAVKRDNPHPIHSAVSIITNLLEERHIDSSSINRLVNKIGWLAPWQLLVIRNYPINVSKLKQRNLLNILRQMNIANISLHYQNDVVLVIGLKDSSLLLETLQSTINLKYYSLGISLPFKHWLELPVYYKQALFAMEEGQYSPSIHYCQDYALEYLVSFIGDRNRALELCHPALMILEEYDQKQQTELFETLYQYVAHERSLVETAKALYIHRNSLIYRIKRIKELIQVDLEDANERVFILLSYLLHDKSTKKRMNK